MENGGSAYEGQHPIWVLDESSEVNPVVYPPGHAKGPRLVTVGKESVP